ncbi:hypothetical protein DSM106972_062020 [Dulcicalothrix desertica PCC 7102]|uniref:HTH cro/C1-type domain-containing protein n=1 Tax=Dulcicalothrix desertica PCC 7102 TaxID=232991 RepID=A0A433V7T0_9CYAN|nr:hypothetical protein [Dulcicalothrix desertica]RUT02127.1 hypothetical protein DSM106972_062020 [Dulcicalothrix desertica PCC 7102]TWH53770.1 hypothetical protein CAL7102_01751 [Dulcicalothrix desertica PCC 7102]
MKVKGALRWKLKVVMDRCQIGTVQLAEFLKVSRTVVSKWRSYEYMPEINEKRYVQIVAAINELCDINGTPKRKIDLWDLIEFCPDELRDFDMLGYNYPSGDARKQPSKDKKKKNLEEDDTNKEESIAA